MTFPETIHPFEVNTSPPTIHTYDDHRMALSFAPAALVVGPIEICCPEVVSKSYPRFWEDLQRLTP